MKSKLLFLGIAGTFIGIVIGSVLLYNSNKIEVDERLEPLIIRVSGLTQYAESSEILSLNQYYNEEEEMYYYEVEFGYERYSENSDELEYKLKNAVFIINHDIPSDNGDFYFVTELELDENKNVKESLIYTKSKYVALATYDEAELFDITNYILEKHGYTN